MQMFVSGFLKCLMAEMRGIDLHDEASLGATDGKYEAAVREILLKDRHASLNYWHDLLADYDTMAEIPSYGTVPEEKRYNEGAQIVSFVDKKTTDILTVIGKQEGSTMSNVVEMLWGMVLQTYSRKDDVVFGKVVSGRDNTEVEVGDVLGLFVNTVPVRVRTGKETTARQLLHQLSDQATASNEHDYCSLSDIQQQSDLGSQLFQTIMAFENFNSGLEMTDAQGSASRSKQQSIIRPVLLKEENFTTLNPTTYMTDKGELCLQIDFDTTLYSEKDIRTIHNLFANIARGIAAAPDVALSQMPLLSVEDTDKVVALSTGETLDYDKSQTWIDLFHVAMNSNPDAIAIVSDDIQLTYSELDRQSDIFASWLMEQSIQRDGFVAIRMDRSALFMVAAMGVHKAGAAYVPIDIDYPQERVDYILSDSAAKLLIIEGTVREAIENGKRRMENGESITPSGFGQQPTPDSLAYMIYTSGSTGKPKGVMIQHHALLNFVHFIRKEWRLSKDSHIACHSNFAFDAAVEDLYPVLTVGGTLYIVPESARKDIEMLKSYIKGNGITGGCYTTQLGQMLGADAPLDVDYICLGGEKMTTVPQSTGRVLNTYGPTEFTVDSTFCDVDKERHYHSIPIGRPLYNLQAFVLDDHQRLVPQGVVGELCMAGPQMAAGYRNRPELTAEVFRDVTICGKTVKVYRTGDLVRYNEDGELEYQGRIDFQVKLRGFRIELGEIEDRAVHYPCIRQVAAEVRNNQFLCLYFTASEEIEESGLRKYLAETLADYMVPSVYMQLDVMPLTPNGKVNRKALPEPELADAENVAPETPSEGVLYKLATGLLKNSDFGVTDNLFNYGMTSLLGMRMVALATKYNIHIKLSDLIKHHSIRTTLKQSHVLSAFAKPYDEKKPVVVLVCGETQLFQLTHYIDALCEHFNVYAFDPLRSHYDTVFMNCGDINEVLSMYSLMLETWMPENARIVAFCGHSFGGEITYRLAQYHADNNGYLPAVELLDSYWNTLESERQTEENTRRLLSDDIQQRHAAALHALFEYDRNWDILKCTGNPVPYAGRHVLFHASAPQPMGNDFLRLFGSDAQIVYDAFKDGQAHADNDIYWRENTPGIEVIDIDADHLSMLEQKYVDKYIKWLQKNIQQ